MKIKLYHGDIDENINLGSIIGIDTETMGLNPIRDKLCLVQLSNGNGICHLIKINNNTKPINLIKILKNKNILKIFHFARFDVAILKHAYKINVKNIYCTKIASKIVRTYTEKHGYKDLCNELINKTISKTEQSSDWGGDLNKKQLEYAATDVLYLHKIKEKLDKMLEREGRTKLAKSCFNFIEQRTDLDLQGWIDIDIFKH